MQNNIGPNIGHGLNFVTYERTLNMFQSLLWKPWIRYNVTSVM